MVANLTYLLDQNNYGQRLQCFALQKFLREELGQDVFTLDSNGRRRKSDLSDDRYFHRFERECMNLRQPKQENLDALAQCEYIVVGGDQVLNTDWKVSENELFPYIWGRRLPQRNVIFYSAGVSAKHFVRQIVLDRLHPHVLAYGLREACANITDHCKTIDPVFLIHDRWEGIARKQEAPHEEMTYIVQNGETQKLSVSRNGVEAILYKRTQQGKGALDPRDFLGLFAGAGRCTTNSYHGFAFALMFRVPCIRLLNKEDHRMQNLITVLGVEFQGDRVVNYDKVAENIRREVAYAKHFLCLGFSQKPQDCFAYTKDGELHRKSSSGGVCAELARRIIERGGVVYGGAFCEGFRRVQATAVHSMEEYFAKLSKSKYSFCHWPDMDALRRDLASGSPIMYVASPCHVAALRKLLAADHDNLLLVDFRCRGFSRTQKLADFIDKVGQEHGGKVAGLDFRPGHKTDQLEVRFEDGRVVMYGPATWRQFVYGAMERCQKCAFAHGMLSCADITVGDNWENSGNRLHLRKAFAPECGCNVVSVNTAKGRAMLGSILDRLNVAARVGFDLTSARKK